MGQALLWMGWVAAAPAPGRCRIHMFNILLSKEKISLSHTPLACAGVSVGGWRGELSLPEAADALQEDPSLPSPRSQ